MHFRFLSRAVPLLAAAAVVLGSATTASAQPLSCGQVVTHSVTLDADLVCSQPGPVGLVVGADGITIDLNGHTIFGNSPGVGTGGGIGIDNRGGYDGVTVRNGTITRTTTAVSLSGASDNPLVGLDLFGAATAVQVEGGQGNVIRGSQIFGRGDGIMATGSTGLRVVDNSVVSAFGSAISVEANGARIARNSINPGGVGARGGIVVAGDLNRIARNVVSGALDSDIRLRSGAGNVIARNWAVHTVPVFENNDSTGDGIHVDAATTGTRVRGNVAANNGDDGIDVESPATTLIGNVANNNHDLGIDAVTGVLDGGGNKASGNGNPLAQCLRVVCG